MPLGPRFNFVLGLAWAVFFILGSLVYRRLTDKHIFRPHFADAVYKESWASGRSLRNVLTRLGGANNCLWITVAGNSLHVGLHFPGTLFFPEFLGLEHSIPAENIVSLEKVEPRFGKPSIRITFRRDASDEETFEIISRRTDELLAALDNIRSKRTRR